MRRLTASAIIGISCLAGCHAPAGPADHPAPPPPAGGHVDPPPPPPAPPPPPHHAEEPLAGPLDGLVGTRVTVYFRLDALGAAMATPVGPGDALPGRRLFIAGRLREYSPDWIVLGMPRGDTFYIPRSCVLMIERDGQ